MKYENICFFKPVEVGFTPSKFPCNQIDFLIYIYMFGKGMQVQIIEAWRG